MKISEIELELAAIKSKIPDFTKLLAELKTAKQAAVVANDQALAKNVWILEEIIGTHKCYLSAFHKMQNKEYYDAWCLLEKVEIKLLYLKKHFNISSNDYELQFIDKIITRYQSVFPYRFFFSTEIIEKEKTCTACGKVYRLREDCGHITGEIYDGQLCLWNVTKFDMVGVAIVENPVHKYSVVFVKNEDGEENKDSYDYASLEYLMPLLKTPFDEWNIDLVHKYVDHRFFKNYSQKEKCPCNQSDKIYSECCLKEKGVKCLFHEFVVDVPSDKVILPKSLRFQK